MLSISAIVAGNRGGWMGWIPNPGDWRRVEKKLVKSRNSAGLGEAFCSVIRRLHVLMGGQKPSEVADRVFADGHLAKVIFPHIRLDGAACERVSVDDDNFAF